MKSKVFLLFVFCFILLSGFEITAFALDDTDSNDMRIFTPYYNIKSVFNNIDYPETIYSEIKNSKVERHITKEELDLIASIVQSESRGEPFEGKVAVASVILNRLDDPDFPKSVEEVIYQKNAFSCVSNIDTSKKPDEESYRAVLQALKGDDPTEKAVFFYNPKTVSNKWMKSTTKNKTTTIGNHVFFR